MAANTGRTVGQVQTSTAVVLAACGHHGHVVETVGQASCHLLGVGDRGGITQPVRIHSVDSVVEMTGSEVQSVYEDARLWQYFGLADASCPGRGLHLGAGWSVSEDEAVVASQPGSEPHGHIAIVVVGEVEIQVELLSCNHLRSGMLDVHQAQLMITGAQHLRHMFLAGFDGEHHGFVSSRHSGVSDASSKKLAKGHSRQQEENQDLHVSSS